MTNCFEFSDVNDIDLVIGGLAEKHLPDSVLGPTFACLTGMQFFHLKFGDRFYFEHGGEVGSFKPGNKNTQTINHNNL